MPVTSLTAAGVGRLKPPKTGQIEYYDRRLPSFGIRISYQGTKSWFVMTRLDGKLIRVTLGKYPARSLAEAREEARRTAGLASVGKDPRRIKADAKLKRLEQRRNTFEACTDEFLERHVERHLRPSTRREYRRVLKGDDTRIWRKRPISEIEKRDVLDVIEAIEARGSPGASKRTLVYLRKFFNWCAERDIITMTPTDRLRSPHPEVKRDRVLTEAELIYFLRALDGEKGPFRPLVRILLLTGQRRAEVAGMLWSEIRGFPGNDAIWEIPGSRTKNKQPHIVPLAPGVSKALLSVPRVGDLIFTTTGETPMSGFGRVKARLDASITALRSADGFPPTPSWTLHDLRRTMVTVMNEKLAIPPHVVEAVVNHTSGLAKAGVAGVYNRALYLDDRRKALNAWQLWIDRLTTSVSLLSKGPRDLVR